MLFRPYIDIRPSTTSIGSRPFTSFLHIEVLTRIFLKKICHKKCISFGISKFPYEDRISYTGPSRIIDISRGVPFVQNNPYVFYIESNLPYIEELLVALYR